MGFECISPNGRGSPDSMSWGYQTCTQLDFEKMNIESTIRLSFAFYNSVAEVHKFLEVMKAL